MDESKLSTHPDFFLIEKRVDEKSGKTKRNIDIDQLRTLRSQLRQSPLLGSYRIAVIDGAELMSTAAANAVLKTLEEPRPRTVLFLLTTNGQQLPQTIHSRCQSVYFH